MLYLAASLHTLGVNVKNRLSREESGATAVEYGIMVGLIAIVIIVGVGFLGKELSTMFNDIGVKLPSV
jgi:pilus assembly protein Flp/PilA